MQTGTPRLLVLCAGMLPLAAQAANWLEVFGNEAADAPRFRPFAIVQPTWTHIDAEPISGLQGPLAAYNGRHIFPNEVPPDFGDTSRLQVMRARLGARGRLTDRINYYALVEAGRNPMTLQRDAVLAGLSLTFNHLPGARIRVGLFKLPTDEEAVMSGPRLSPYVYFSDVVQNLLVEPPLRALGPSSNPTLTRGEMVSGCSCLHDWGVQGLRLVSPRAVGSLVRRHAVQRRRARQPRRPGRQ